MRRLALYFMPYNLASGPSGATHEAWDGNGHRGSCLFDEEIVALLLWGKPCQANGSRRGLLAYHVSGQQVVRADVPFWFFSVKGPAVQYALRGTDFDLAALNLTPSELEAAGPCVVIDEVRPNGDRLLAWTT